MWSYHWPPEYSGAGLQARRLALALTARGWSVWTLTCASHVERLTETDGGGLRVVSFPRPRSRSFKVEAARTIWRFWRALRPRRGTFDILHCHSAHFDAALAASCAKRWGKRCLIKNTLVGADLAQWGQGIWGKWQQRAIPTAGAFVGPSREAADEFLRAGLPPERVHHIPNGVDTAEFRPAAQDGERRALRARLGLPPDARIALSLSAIMPRKGSDLLAEAFARVAPEHADLHLALVGPWERDGHPLEGTTADWFPNLRQRIASLGLAGRVHFPGRQSNAEEWLRAADLFAFPAVNEGLPNALLEAMATGLPIAAADIPPLAGVVADGETALLAKPGDVDSFASVLGRLAADAALAARLGASARAHIEAAFSLDRVVRAYEELYLSLGRPC
jgi:glycosyltransferase involved in cell wall biosynthesis